MAKGCLQTQYKITMWEDIGVHDMDRTRPHKLQSPLHKTCGSTQSCVPIDPCHNLQSYPGREMVRRGHKGTDHDRTKSGSPLQKSSTMVYMALTCILGLTMV
jgi:hypothetical protein